VKIGQPVLGICRGFQEMAVAMGCSLHPEIRDLSGRMNHRMPPDGTLEEKFELRHAIKLSKDGPFHRLFGATEVMTNSLHGQGLKTQSDQIVVDGVADDGTAEAIYVKDAPGFTLSVQWHPEWDAANDPVSRPLFKAFGQAVHEWANAKGTGQLRSA
jgi:putative glutamine amidotransferase